ncbi:MSMEG_0565 family glycosyltransferase [Methylocapsa sp. S129]|uniref:MSMEG_0565 family glycosyltransferase n=1 Tax=Methylocapsa sp. S129 TaxID=1641869 RepID=UPI00131DBB73|nr:MSMEG_0565 family glycosyltransferase [Methylocapsa sp. S129]
MTSAPPLRVAILAHSTNPRGGVVHALELGDALTRLGCEIVVHAPDVKGTGFFRETLCGAVSVPASPVGADRTAMVEARIADYVAHFENPAHRRFDVFHAQDGISGNALATLKERGLIRRFARTVHHVDAFADQRLSALQTRAILDADELFVVSRLWRDHLGAHFGRAATLVGNGVDRIRFSPQGDRREDSLRARLGLKAGPIFLAIGGVEERKNTIGVLEAFAQVRRIRAGAQLLIAGGASLLDHADYQARFSTALAASGLPPGAVAIAGPIAQSDLPALYRIADALVFPSVKEGFGLVVLEAMASGVPVVTSRIAPFTEYLAEDDVVWCRPNSISSIADAMLMALAPVLRARLVKRGLAVAARHDWLRVGAAHRPVYDALAELEHA